MNMFPIVFYLRVALGLFRGHVYVDLLLAELFQIHTEFKRTIAGLNNKLK